MSEDYFCPAHVFTQMCDAVGVATPSMTHKRLKESLHDEFIAWTEQNDLEGHEDDSNLVHAFLAEKVVVERYYEYRQEQITTRG